MLASARATQENTLSPGRGKGLKRGIQNKQNNLSKNIGVKDGTGFFELFRELNEVAKVFNRF